MKRKRIFFAAICAALLAVASHMLYHQYWIHTPEFALEEASKAVEERDELLFRQYVDTDSFIEQAYDEAAAELVGSLEVMHERYPEDFFFVTDAESMRDYTQEYRGDVLSLLKEMQWAYFTNADTTDSFLMHPARWLTGEMKAFMQNARPGDFHLVKEEDRAICSVVLHGADTEYGKLMDGLRFELELRKQANGQWKITRIANVSELFPPLVDITEKYWELQGWGTGYPQ